MMEQLVDARVSFIPGERGGMEYFPSTMRCNEKRRSAAHLLIVADFEINSAIAESLSEFFRVHSVLNTEDAWDEVRKILPDMVLFEAGMPWIKAKEFVRLLQNNSVSAHIPLIFITGKHTVVDDFSLFSLGAIDCLRWPFDVSLINMKLYNMLENNARVQRRAGILQLRGTKNIALSYSDEDFLKDVVAVIDSFIDDPGLDVEQLSESLKMTPNQIYRKIKRLSGFTAKKFISTHRLNTAADYLTHCTLNISEVAYMTGFSSPSYFSKCFKDQFGCTPKESLEKEKYLKK